MEYTILKSHVIAYNIGEGSLEVKLPTIWTDGKAQSSKSHLIGHGHPKIGDKTT